MYQLKIAPKAKKQLKQISKVYQRNAVYNALQEIKEDPFSGKELTRELTGSRTYKMGIYRIIYKIDVIDKKVYVISAGHRSIVYQ